MDTAEAFAKPQRILPRLDMIVDHQDSQIMKLIMQACSSFENAEFGHLQLMVLRKVDSNHSGHQLTLFVLQSVQAIDKDSLLSDTESSSSSP